MMGILAAMKAWGAAKIIALAVAVGLVFFAVGFFINKAFDTAEEKGASVCIADGLEETIKSNEDVRAKEAADTEVQRETVRESTEARIKIDTHFAEKNEEVKHVPSNQNPPATPIVIDAIRDIQRMFDKGDGPH